MGKLVEARDAMTKVKAFLPLDSFCMELMNHHIEKVEQVMEDLLHLNLPVPGAKQ